MLVSSSVPVLDSLSSTPLSLFQLAFVKVSDVVGCPPARQKKVNALNIPPPLKKALAFKDLGTFWDDTDHKFDENNLEHSNILRDLTFSDGSSD